MSGPPPPDDVARLISAVGRWRLRRADEHELQDAIEELLTAECIPYEREVELSKRDRPDFMLRRVAVEVKTKGSPTEVGRQLLRYAAHEGVEQILLLTTKSGHTQLPTTLLGKKLTVLYVSSL